MTKPSWWQRNWKWAAPAGCLGPVLFFAGLGFLIYSLVFGAMTSSWAYNNAVRLAESNVEVLRNLGEPLEIGWFVSGEISVSDSSGDAELAIPIEGPLGSGTLYVVALKEAGRWHLEVAEVEVKGQVGRINLLVAPQRKGMVT